MCKTQIGNACQASKILLNFLLAKLKTQSSKEASSQTVTLSPKQLLLPIKALCTAKPMLQMTDYVTITSMMKNATLPPHIKTALPGKSIFNMRFQCVKNHKMFTKYCILGEKETSVLKEVKRSRTDLSFTLMAQLTSPLYDFSLVKSQQAAVSESGNKTNETTTHLNENMTLKELEVS